MRNITQNAPFLGASASVSGRAAAWNLRLLTASAVLVLWAASLLALQASGPNARAMFGGEGMSIISGD